MNMVKIICGIDYDLFAYIKMKVAIDDDKEEDNIEKWNEIEERIVYDYYNCKLSIVCNIGVTMQSV